MGSRGNPVIQSLVFSLTAGPAEISRPLSAKRMLVAEPKPFRLFFGAFSCSRCKGELFVFITPSLTSCWVFCNLPEISCVTRDAVRSSQRNEHFRTFDKSRARVCCGLRFRGI